MALPTPDPQMTAAEDLAFETALRRETNPNHLYGFAHAMSPDHCVSASFLYARGSALDLRRRMDRRAFHALLAALSPMAARGCPSTAHVDARSLARGRVLLDAIAHANHVDPRMYYRLVRQTAGELVVDEQASLTDLPAPVASLARLLVLSVGPVRVLDPAAVRASLPSSNALANAPQREERARWVRHYVREARLR